MCLLCRPAFVSGQMQDDGYARIIQDPRIDSLMLLSRQLNSVLSQRDEGYLDGFRIQIFMESGNDAIDHANAVIERFSENFPGVPVYLIYRQPYYRIRVGDFRTRLEAEGYLRRIVRNHSQAFVIKDKVRMPQLIYFTNQKQEYEQEDFSRH